MRWRQLVIMASYYRNSSAAIALVIGASGTSYDRLENERSLKDDFRLLSAYRLSDGTKIWIVTEADRASTTILLPEEY